MQLNTGKKEKQNKIFQKTINGVPFCAFNTYKTFA